MAIVAIRPDSTVTNTFNVAGAASAHLATSDDNDASYIDDDGSGYKETYLNFGTYTIPAGQFVRQVRLKYRYITIAPGAITLWYSRFVDANGTAESPETHNQMQSTITTETGGWRTTAPSGNLWNQSEINGLAVNIYPGLWTGNIQMHRFYELYAELDVNANPTTSVTGPASPVTTTSRPAVVFSYSDADGDAMEAYQIRIFTSAQYTAAGFSPWTSPATWDSGRVNASIVPTGGVRPTVDLQNLLTYRAYVFVFQSGAPLQGPGNGISDGTAFRQFTMNITPPALPTVSSSIFNAFGITVIRILFSSNDSLTQFVSVEKSSDGGATWSKVRNATDYKVAQGTTYTAYDIEVPASTNIIYRAKSSYTSGGSTISSNWTSSTSAVQLIYSDWILRNPSNPIVDFLVLSVVGDSFDQVKPEDKAIFNPLGRTRKVSVADVIKGEEASMVLEFAAEADYVKFEQLRGLQTVLLLQRGWTKEQWYITFTEHREMNLFRYTPTYRYVKIGWVEVDAPAI